MAELSVRVLKRGLTDEERQRLTLEDLRMTRLEALRDDQPVVRHLPRPGSKGDPVPTTAPTLEHLSGALELPLSSVRSYWSGRNTPRMLLDEMVRLADALGLTVEEFAAVVRNSAKARLESQGGF